MNADAPLWLAEAPPRRGDGARGGNARRGGEGMEGMAMGGERGGKPGKRVWLRAGDDPQASALAQMGASAQPDLLLVAPGKEAESLPLPEVWQKGMSFEMPVQGYYRLYLVNRKLQGATLNVDVAKAEITNFRHGGDPEEVKRALVAPRMLATAPLEIVRERQPDEKLYYQLRSGVDQVFTVLRAGQPQPGARVRFISHQGWVKEQLSDAQGQVSFQVVRDYFPPWEEFQKRFKATYLVIAEASAAEAGEYQGQAYADVRYRSSLSGSYYPSPNDYLSYAWGLGLSVVLILFCGVAVYLYRRRRLKPFREVRFNEN